MAHLICGHVTTLGFFQQAVMWHKMATMGLLPEARNLKLLFPGEFKMVISQADSIPVVEQ